MIRNERRSAVGVTLLFNAFFLLFSMPELFSSNWIACGFWTMTQWFFTGQNKARIKNLWKFEYQWINYIFDTKLANKMCIHSFYRFGHSLFSVRCFRLFCWFNCLLQRSRRNLWICLQLINLFLHLSFLFTYNEWLGLVWFSFTMQKGIEFK